jgi:uncharacterized protein with HEPN domain
MRDDRERLLNILEAIQRVEEYSNQGRDAFDREPLIQVWIVHHLQIVGEASRQLSGDFTQSHPEIAWAQIVAMRNILVHNYFGIDLEEVWSAVEKDIPLLKIKIIEILKQNPG